MSLEARAKAAAELVGAKELELCGIEIRNPKLRAVLESGGFTLTIVSVPEELGGGDAEGVSRLDLLE